MMDGHGQLISHKIKLARQFLTGPTIYIDQSLIKELAS
jgi:hypothetical protein